MRIIHSPRQAGKTTELIEWAKEDPLCSYIIVMSKNEEERLRMEYPEIARCFIFWEDFLEAKKRGGFSGGHSRYTIDNADHILEKIFGKFIHTATFTKEIITIR